jgi:4-hydroxy-2-oxoglutarate aldolase
MSGLRLNGIIPPLTTPFDDEGNVDLESLAANVERYNRTGLVGYVALGSNGEAVHLTTHERLEVIETIRRASAPGRTIIAGVNELSTRAAIDFTRRSADSGAEAVLVVTPYYYKSSMTQEALFRYYTAVADSSPVPVLLYNVPQNTGIILEPATIASLAEHQNIVGVKDSAGNVSAISDTLRLAPPSFAVLAGSGSILYPSLLLGAAGAILAVACVAPEACVELYEAARSGDLERARELHNRVAPLSHAVTAKFGVAGLKAAMDFAQFVGGVPRAPLLRLSEANLETLRALMRGSGLFPYIE